MVRTPAVVPFEDDLAALFEDDFDPPTYQRGRAYAQQGRATVTDVVGGGETLQIIGQCLGSKGRTYQVSVSIDVSEHDEPFVFDDACTCPIGTGCKHVVALLLSFVGQLGASEAPAASPAHAPAGNSDGSGAGLELRPETLEWLALFDGPEPGDRAGERLPPGAPEAFVVYLLHPDPRPTLSLGKSKPLKRGGTSKPVSFTPQSSDLSATARRDFVRADDEVPLQLYLGQRSDPYAYGYGYSQRGEVPIVGEGGAVLLAHAARTGRLYVAGDMSAPLVAEGRPLRLKWHTDERGRQQLAFDVPAHVYILPTWPPHYFDPHSRNVGALDSEWPAELLKKLIRAPALNEHEATLVRARLEDWSRRSAVTLPLPTALETRTPAAPPSATLTLTKGRFRHEAMISLHDEYPIARLRFDYAEGVSAAGAERPEPLLQFERDGAKIVLRRDLDTERAVWRALQSVGLESRHQRMSGYEWLDDAGDCLLTKPVDARGWMALLDDGLARLAAAGLRVEYADDFPFRLAQPDDWFVALDESPDSDWFDLDLGVLIDGERVSLVPPLLNLFKEQPHILKRLDALPDSERLPLRLDAQRLLPVPVARLRAWLRPLLEFLDDDRPRLSRYHAAALAELGEHDAQWLSGAALRELGERLRDFSGIAEALPAPHFGATLRAYQQAGLNWLQFLRSYGLSGILADDMGLGKTVQTLAHLQLEKAAGRADRPSLVIAPTSLLPNWAAEARQFAPDLKVLTLHGPERARHFDAMAGADLILTTYPLLVRDREALTAGEYHLLVLDEAQFIKNPKAQSHAAARELVARHRLSLTGTPLENHLGELWAQFDFLMPGLLGNVRRFNEVFRTPIEKQGDGDARERLARRVAPFMLRRTKEQVLAELPPRTEIVRWVELSDAQRDLYESLRVAFDKKLREALATQGVGRSQIMILDALLKLRQACCDPRLVQLASAQQLGKQGLAASAKLAELMTLLEELLDEGRRVLLFSQFTSMLGLIEDELRRRKWQYAKLTGQTRDRDTPVRDFQDGRVPIFMVSLKAGGTGLNLTAADTVIHYDPWWNPAVEAQATARAHRIGQHKPVFVYKLLGRGTVEEKILALQARKRGLADQLLAGRGDEAGGHLITAEDLDVLFEPLAAG
ncbi:MAG TPA: DEAD/DEAH box helicase [Rhodocyclaceae bacterium]|nr:DEAD/DEAH box helicase [Rhodocyclaceae bacterium]